MTTIHDDLKNIRNQYEEIQSVKVSLALFGQPGAGKSSLINCLVGKKVAEVGTKNDITQEASSHEWNGLYLVDLPGYGTKMFPADTYLEKFDILNFDFFLCVFSGTRLKEDDIDFFKKLREIGKYCLFVCNQVDRLWQEDRTLDDIKADIVNNIEEQVGIKETIYFTSCRHKDGLDKLTEGIYDLLGDIDSAKQEMWAKSAKAYSQKSLDEKKRACEKFVAIAAGTSAVNGFNPVPGVDIAVDVGILVRLNKQLKDYYGLTDEGLKAIEIAVPTIAPIVKNLVQYVATDGVLFLLKKYAGMVAVQQFSKWIPLVGQIIAPSVGFGLTMAVGSACLNDCHQIAEAILQKELEKMNK